MEANFELWEEGAREMARDRVNVTLNNRCQLYFNGHALEALGEPDAVALLYDPRKKIIGVMPSTINKKHSYPLRRKHCGQYGRVITIRNFCDNYKIKPSETLVFPTATINRDGIMMLDLHAVVTVKRGSESRIVDC